MPTMIIVRGLATSWSRRGAGVPAAKMLDTREYATLEDLARAKGVNVTYVSRILQLTPLAPGSSKRSTPGRRQIGPTLLYEPVGNLGGGATVDVIRIADLNHPAGL